MHTPSPTLVLPRGVRRALDLCGAAALAAALVHVVIAVARGWPRAKFIDAPTADVTLGVFLIVAVLYAARWFVRPAGAPLPTSTLFGTKRRPWVTPLIRTSGRAAGVAALAYVALAVVPHPGAEELTLRTYYAAFLCFAIAWRVAPRYWA